jgi:glucosamine--fructose-6-phosphate aminotransferase (isomerizing)
MCGIFGYVGVKKIEASTVLAGLKSLEYRGYDSWGLVVSSNNALRVRKQVGKIGDAVVDDLPPTELAFGHTRWATHGGVTEANAHPHLDCSERIAVVHNGIFENYAEVRAELIKKGHTFKSETDTEVIAHLIEEHARTLPFSEAVETAYHQMHGLNAIIVTEASTKKLFALKQGSPLIIGFAEEAHYLASDPAALLPFTSEVYFMEDNEMAIVEPQKVSITNLASQQAVEYQKQILPWELEQAVKGQYPHFMIKEIHEQPEILQRIANSDQDYQSIVNQLRDASHSVIMGCGTAAYAAQAAAYLFSHVAQFDLRWAVASEWEHWQALLPPKSTILALSQSGETMDLIEPVKIAQQNSTHIIALVNVFGSTLFRLADQQVVIGAGPEKAVASTKAFTGKIAHLIRLAYTLAGKEDEGRDVLKQAIQSIQQLLLPTHIDTIKQLATDLAEQEHIYIIGRGLSFPASLEAALKIKEISYIHAESLLAGELKHGPLALIQPGTPCIVFAPKDSTYSATLNSAAELKARGGKVIGVSHQPSDIFDTFIEVPSAGVATLLPNVVFAQLLSYYLSVHLRLDPDMPRNLAKSVTVK